MDYKKKYKEALVNMQELYNSMKYMSSTDALHTTTALERAFPELKENKNERIRKAIFKALSKKDARNVLLSQNIEVSEALDWLEKQGEQKPAWSEDDELDLEDAIHAAKELYDANCGGDELVDWLKSLKDRVQPQPQKEWSEEDERMRKASIRACQYMVENFENSTWDYEDAIDWLNSLKNCVQPQWKPSSEYIAALEYQVNSTCKGSWQYKASKELLEQLKKL